MKFRTLTLISAMTVVAAMAISVQLSAQAQPATNRSAFSAFQAPHAGSFRPTPGMRATAKNENNGTLGTADGSAPSHIITFDAPQAGKGFLQGTEPMSINAGGTITGAYFDSHGLAHGLLRTPDGTITSIDVPDALQTAALGINDKGAITGGYLDSNGVVHGFMRSPDGTSTTFVVPDAESTYGVNINDAGTISGNYTDQRGTGHGFVLDVHGNFTTFDAPGASFTNVVPNGMNAKGAITGNVFANNAGEQGFLRSPNGNMLPTFGVYGAIFTVAEGMPTNNSQTVVGYSFDQSFVYHGFLRTGNGIRQLNDPNAGVAPGQGTQAYAINATNWTTGTYAAPNPNEPFHGFVRSPGGVFTTFDAPGAVETVPVVINPAGAIAGYYFDENMAFHGFLRTP